MTKEKKLLIPSLILMCLSIIALFISILCWNGAYDALHSGSAEVIAIIIMIPLYMILAVACLALSIIPIVLSSLILRIRKMGGAIATLIISSLIALAIITLTILLFVIK